MATTVKIDNLAKAKELWLENIGISEIIDGNHAEMYPKYLPRIKEIADELMRLGVVDQHHIPSIKVNREFYDFVTDGEGVFKIDDEVIVRTLHGAWSKCKVIRTTKTQAILDNKERLPIDGVNGCKHIKNYYNRHMVHYQTYYKLRDDLLKEAQDKGYLL